MIVDSSALIAILREEADAARFAEAIANSAICRMSAANYLEAAIVIDGSGDPVASRRFDNLVLMAGIKIEPVTEEQVKIARVAFSDFGKGSGHPARLNFGDCFAYALAKVSSEKLLFKGNDFRYTDLAQYFPISH